MDVKREFLRHAVATVAYRGAKAVRDAPAAFETCRAAPGSRTAGEILAHTGDLFDWALSQAKGAEAWRESPPLPWDAEVDRLFQTLGAFDMFLASNEPVGCSMERLLQGPIADALTHIGQIALLRRFAGSPVHGESYARAEIVAGRVGREQAAPRRTFE